MKMYGLWLSCLLCIAAGEGQEGSGKTDVEKVAATFSDAYFNYDFKRAEKYITPESRQWLYFAASNVSQATLDVLNQLGEEEQPTVFVGGTEVIDDSTQAVSVSIRNIVDTDSIGQPPTLRDEETFRLTLVNREDNWMVKMEGLPRSEKRSRD